ncbi:hypothetical protein J2Z30_005975 [Streptomyces iranensis]|uniref:Uncharacterized protein n=1 Tax=Streptomyces iranensis TaxID=576784 RepID=A0ABS4MYV6_9ACTN|nr:hypothetical protein [Streptomyces iranensis]
MRTPGGRAQRQAIVCLRERGDRKVDEPPWSVVTTRPRVARNAAR